MRRYTTVLTVASLLTAITSVTATDDGNDLSSVASNLPALKYFDVSDMEYTEPVKPDVPEEYLIPVEIAYVLAALYYEEFGSGERRGDFTGDYIIAYNHCNECYEYGFVTAKEGLLPFDMEKLSKGYYKIFEKYAESVGGTKRIDSTSSYYRYEYEVGDVDDILAELEQLGVYPHDKEKYHTVCYVPVDKRADINVHFSQEAGLPVYLKGNRPLYDKIAREVLGRDAVLVRGSSRPAGVNDIIEYGVRGTNERIYFVEHISGDNFYYDGDDFFGEVYPTIYRKDPPENPESNVELWNGYIESLDNGYLPDGLFSFETKRNSEEGE